MGRRDEDWAVFWCSLLSDVLLGEIPANGRERYFQTLSQQERLLPNGQRRRISARTLRRQWNRLRENGVEGLYRRRRGDRGKPRKDVAILERAVELKKEQPYRSAEAINRVLQREFGRQVPRSTLYAHLHRQGATKRKLGLSVRKVRCRWTRDQSNALWVGDFEHGPPVIQAGRMVKSYLSAWIDCHSRFIVEARYYIRENLDILIDSLLRAWGHHGASRELYVDNAKIYHAKSLKLACTQLNIKLLHRPPRDPPPGGLIERYIRTVQEQLEAEIRASDVLSLDQLNHDLAAWLECEYHDHLHSETGQTPRERFLAGTRFTRLVDLNTVLTFFHRREERTVDDVHSDVQVDKMLFAVDPVLRKERVIVQFDPHGSATEVHLHDFHGNYLGRGLRYERKRGTHPYTQATAAPPALSTPITPHYLNALREEYARRQEQQSNLGLDYHSARQRNTWSLPSFANKVARLLGRSGGVSGLTQDEMAALDAFHKRHDRVTEPLLKQAFARAEGPSLPHVLLHLQTLLDERND